MARTVLTVQRLSNRAGQAITFSPMDTINGFQYRNTGVEVVLVKLDSGSAVTVGVGAAVDPFNRTETVSVAIAAANGTRVQSLGPYTPQQNWGDGSSQGFLDVSGVSGTSGIAVISI
jgi:hypothetical protein